jgi:arylsulfatase A-like enzyme
MNRPNILFITAEQQRGDTLHCDGADWMRTPHLDRLAARSAIFTNAFCPAATCISSRAAFYTGLYPHSTGMYGFYRSSGRLHWTSRLAESGYHCVSIGKTHLPHAGFQESIAEQHNKCATMLAGAPCEWYRTVQEAGYEPPFDLHETDPHFYDNLGAIVWPLPEELHPDIYVGDRTLDWLDRWDGDRPFYLHVGFLSPHDLYDPPQRFIDQYDDESIPMPSASAQEIQGIPDELFAEQRRDEGAHGITVIKASRATPERIRRMRKHYYASITMIDEKVGQILEKLCDKGLEGDTIVIYTSDHGDHLFDHGLYYKGELYDTIVRVPLLVSAPDAHQPGCRVDDLVSQLDTAQYILEKAGVKRDDLDGLSLAPTVEAGEPHRRRYAFAEEGATGLRPEPDLLAMIRSRSHKLIYFTGNRTGQLFDLSRDPGETSNLWHDPAQRPIRDELTAELLDWLYTGLYRHRDLFVEAR